MKHMTKREALNEELRRLEAKRLNDGQLYIAEGRAFVAAAKARATVMSCELQAMEQRYPALKTQLSRS